MYINQSWNMHLPARNHIIAMLWSALIIGPSILELHIDSQPVPYVRLSIFLDEPRLHTTLLISPVLKWPSKKVESRAYGTEVHSMRVSSMSESQTNDGHAKSSVFQYLAWVIDANRLCQQYECCTGTFSACVSVLCLVHCHMRDCSVLAWLDRLHSHSYGFRNR